jgi:NTP pyrophosphatase (non-canonical NTP hydrolase)
MRDRAVTMNPSSLSRGVPKKDLRQVQEASKMPEAFAPLTIAEYDSQVRKTDKGSDGGSLDFTLLGLFGETGSLLSEVKKKQRDKVSYLGYAENVAEELGDVLWYLTSLARRCGLSLTKVASNIERTPAEWQKTSDNKLTFAALQPERMPRREAPTPAFENTLLRLAGQVGLIMTDHEAGNFKGNQSALGDRLLAVMRTLVQAANDAGVTLEAAAVKNLHKTFDRWPPERHYPTPLDAEADPEEQLPRDLLIEIFEREVDGRTYVFQRCNGINIGDRLTDNFVQADDYRFHDIFHYAYVAILGWSPVVRALFRLKRKSQAEIDEAQDGARAILIEEGVASWIFGQAKDLEFFAKIQLGELPFGMLKNIRQFVKGYECDEQPLWLWEEAILQGFAAFRFLQKHRRGRVHIDMINHRLTIEPLS